MICCKVRLLYDSKESGAKIWNSKCVMWPLSSKLRSRKIYMDQLTKASYIFANLSVFPFCPWCFRWHSETWGTCYEDKTFDTNVFCLDLCGHVWHLLQLMNQVCFGQIYPRQCMSAQGLFVKVRYETWYQRHFLSHSLHRCNFYWIQTVLVPVRS